MSSDCDVKLNRLVAFTSYYFATKAEEVLKEGDFKGKLIATPPSLHHMCGLCILLNEGDLRNYIKSLRSHSISHSGVFVYKGLKESCEKLHYSEYE